MLRLPRLRRNEHPPPEYISLDVFVELVVSEELFVKLSEDLTSEEFPATAIFHAEIKVIVGLERMV